MRHENRANLLPLIILGSLWGLTEAAAGFHLRGSCARLLSGSLLLGGSLFFLSASYSSTRRLLPLLLLPFLAALYKLYTAFLLSLPVLHGAVANPIFAYFTQSLSFIILLLLLKPALLQRTFGRALLGGLSALLAVNLFPAVKFFTGIPACTLPGTALPLSLWGAPVAVSLSLLTTPLGFLAGNYLARFLHTFTLRRPHLAWTGCFSFLFLCFLLVPVILP